MADKASEKEKSRENKEIENGREADYRSAYEREHLLNADLAGRIADLEAKCAELEFKLNRIKTNPLWKMSGPLRRCMHFVLRQRDRLRNCGNLRGFIGRLNYKKIELKARENYGTKSFPTLQEAKASLQHAGEFPAGDDRFRYESDL